MPKQRIKLYPRSDPVGFAQRALKNLEIIEHQYDSHRDGHVVTQLILSTLGLLVYPYHADAFSRFKSWRLGDLQKKGWPAIRQYPSPKQADNLEQLLHYMRNAVCHRGVAFLSDTATPDSREVRDITLEFINRGNKNPQINWRMEIDAVDLRALCVRVFYEIAD